MKSRNSERNVIVAITGASGAPYAKKLIQELYKTKNIKASVLISEIGQRVYEIETGNNIAKDLPENIKLYGEKDITFPFISGSNKFYAMVIVPCSMATLAAIAHGTGSNIIHRTADVCLKEKRKLILVPRETPLNITHIRNMLICAEMGAIIMPAMPGFYNSPKSLSDIINFMVSRILDHLEIRNHLIKRWDNK